MTDQILDKLIYHEYECPIFGINGEGYFSPKNWGITTVSISTACYRGHYLRYACADDILLLNEMTICTIDDCYPEIAGVRPFVNFREEIWHARTYSGLKIGVPFTGGLVVGQDYGPPVGDNRGFPGYWSSYRTLCELIFSEGHLIKDQSYLRPETWNEMKPIYDQLSQKYDFFYTIHYQRKHV